MLNIPSYITKSGICGSPIKYSWRPDQDVQITDKYSKNIERLVDKLSIRASLTLGIGVGEWLMWRLHGISKYERIHQYIEALWARTVAGAYLKVDQLEHPDDKGDPATGPLFGL